MRLELLSPAPDLASGLAAIHAGADAVYVGPPRFGARQRAANSLEDIAALVREAHIFDARVYATLNTLLYDHELGAAERLAWDLHGVGVDALIVQDMAFARMSLPPLELHASTQMDCRTLARVQFLEGVGFARVVLARELSLAEIARIRRHTSVELEAFVHGALCVSYSGQCYLSEYLGGRSANRGDCAQPCRRAYRVEALDGRQVAGQGHWLSLRDLHRAGYLEALVDAGVTSFKIEGRLKDLAYVQNVTAYYSQALDGVVAGGAGLARASLGRSEAGFSPDPHVTFARPFTPYGLDGARVGLAYVASPKSMGEPLGRVARVAGRRITLDRPCELSNGDGLALESGGVVRGVRAERGRGRVAEVRRLPPGVGVGDAVYRNWNAAARRSLSVRRCARALGCVVRLGMAEGQGYYLELSDEGGRTSRLGLPAGLALARDAESQGAAWARVLGALGEGRLRVEGVDVCAAVPFLPLGQMKAFRRSLVERHLELLGGRRRAGRAAGLVAVPFPAGLPTDVRLNATNGLARAFYRACGVASPTGVDGGAGVWPGELMRTVHCVRRELGRCPRAGGQAEGVAAPLRLVGAGRPLYLLFDCARCEMVVSATRPAGNAFSGRGAC